jgi:drug/metabolite transporter (DMT)-like permease
MRNPILAAILSLIVAGLGQIYNGQIGKGVIFIVIQLINGALTAVLIGWILLPIVGHDRRVHDREAQQRALRLQVISVPWTDETC